MSPDARLRVLVTTSTFPVNPDDGVPRFVYDLAQSLTAHAAVTVLAPDAAGARRSERQGDLEIRRFTYFRPRRLQRLALGQGMRDNLRGSPLAKAQVPGYLLRQASVTRRLIRDGNIDVVNAHWLVPQGLTSAWACRGGRARLVLHVHAGDVYLLRRMRFGRAIARYVISRSAAILADGSHVRDTLDELLGFDSGAALRPMGVHVSTFGRQTVEVAASEDAMRIDGMFPQGFLFFFGRLSEKKGAIYLIRGLPRVLERHPRMGLVLVGDGPERASIEEEVRRLGLVGSVTLLGRRSHRDIAHLLRRCRAAIVPSIVDSRGETEGMPTVVLEGLAAGVRVVASAVDGIPDVLRHRDNGWLCRAKDPEDLAAKVLEALEDPAESGVVARAAATASAHDWIRVASEYTDVLRRAVEDREVGSGQ